MIFLKIAIILICSALFAWGGYSWHNARRFILPCILSLACILISKSVLGITSLSVIGVFCLGYGVKSPIRHCFGDGWGRGVWGLLSGLCISLFLFLTGHLAWYFLVPYLALCFILENALKKVNQIIGDCIIGAGFGCIVFLIH